MTITLETYLLVSLAFAVFAAVVAVGSSLVLGAGFERLKISFEVISKQTGFFSDALFRMEHRVEALEEQEQQPAEAIEEDTASSPAYIFAEQDGNIELPETSKTSMWDTAEAESVRFH